MTINIAVVTSEALVLGCDSISSVTQYFVDPFSLPMDNVDGERFRLELSIKDLVPQVTNCWDGVTKMFALNERENTPVGGITAGLARLNGRSMKSYADEFLRDKAANRLTQHTVEEVATNFLAFMRQGLLSSTNIVLPEELNTELPQVPAFFLDWEGFRCNIAYGNLSEC
jgi:hypothetical protein